jgi:hypothetical protein
MCRNIKPLFNFDPPATDEEVRDAALQFVRKLSGFTHPSAINEAAFERGIDDIAVAARHLLDALVTNAEPRDRDIERAKAKARAAKRFGTV